MRVLHVENSSGRGGSLKSLAACWPAPEGWSSRVIALERPWAEGTTVPVPVDVIPRQNLWACRRVMREHRIDIVHVNNAPWEGRAAILAARWEGIPVVSHMRTVRPLRKLERLFLVRGLQALWVLGEEHRRRFSPHAPVFVLRNPVGDPGRRPRPEDPTIGVFSVLKPGKGHEDLLRALKDLDPTVRLNIVGGPVTDQPSTRPDLERLIVELGLKDRVSWTGHVEDPASEMARCRVVVDPSRKAEGLRRTCVEAALTGRPVVATDVGCAADWLPEKCRVPAGDPVALARALRQGLEMSEDLRDAARKLFDARARRHDFWQALASAARGAA